MPLGGLVLALVLATVMGLTVLGFTVSGRLSEFGRAQSSIADWPLSQLEVGIITLIEANQDPNGNLDLFRERFHTYLNQIDMLRQSPLWGVVAEEGRMQAQLATLKSSLHALTSLVDGPENVLRGARPYLIPRLEDMREEARQISITGVALSALASEYRQEKVMSLVRLMAIGALALIVVLVISFYALNRQYRLAMASAADAHHSNRRLKSTINAALDAIVVCDANKTIIGFNPAAEAVFGYNKASALGMRFEALFATPRDGQNVHNPIHLFEGAGQNAGGGSGRIEVEARHRNGERFIVELSMGMVKGSDGPIYNAFMRDISEQKRITEELHLAYDAALKSGRARSNFLAVMSHEMRTALNGVIGVLELLQATSLDKKQKRYTDIAAKSSDILLRHINDVLDLAMVTAGKLVIQPAPFDLPALLREVIEINQPAALTRGNALTLELDQSIGFVEGDRMRIEQIMINLVSNALKFTERGSVTVEARRLGFSGTAEMVELAVRDTGRGIAADDHERIFDEFVAVGTAPKRSVSGSGLGLSICRHIARVMQGEMGVTSSLGEGSRFWVHLPLKPALAGDEVCAPLRLAPPPILHHAPDVLVIEDNCISRFVARHMLSEAGCQVTEASNGHEGIALAAEQRFDFILMDISMPGLDGRETCIAIRRGFGLSAKSPIIGLTAHAMPAERQEYLSAGMLMCLYKPLRRRDVEHVLAVVREQATPQEDKALLETALAHPPLDMSVLAELGDIFPAPVLADRAEDFARNIDTMLSRIADAVAAGNRSEASDIAHNLAGGCAVFGTLALRHKLQKFVIACRTDADDLEARRQALVPAANAAKAELDQYMRQAVPVEA